MAAKMERCIIIFLLLLACSLAKKSSDDDKPAWAKKNLMDYSDADLERLYDQWEEDEEPLEEDELPEHLRPQPQVDMSQMDFSDPQKILKLTKKGKTLMSFVSVTGNPARHETDEMTKLWQSSLWNNHIQAERFMVDDARAIFLFKDGSQAWEAKDFLIEQERCAEVVIENYSYYGKHTEKGKKQQEEEEAKKHKKKDEL